MISPCRKYVLWSFQGRGLGFDGNDPYYLPYGFDALSIDDVRFGHIRGVVYRMRK